MYVAQGSEMGRMEDWEGMSMRLWNLANFSRDDDLAAILLIS